MSDTVIAPIELEDGTVIYMEATRLAPSRAAESRSGDVSGTFATDSNGGGWGRSGDVSGDQKVPEIPKGSINTVLKGVEQLAKAVAETAEKSNAFEIAVEFGIELGVDTNGTLTSLFVKGTGKANMKVSLKWSHASKRTVETDAPTG